MSSDDSRRRGERGESTRDLDQLKTDLGTLVADHPVGVLAAAVGVGYAVGGGVFTRLTSRLLRLGVRLGIQLAVMPVIEQELATLLGAGKPADGSGEDAPARDPTHH